MILFYEKSDQATCFCKTAQRCDGSWRPGCSLDLAEWWPWTAEQSSHFQTPLLEVVASNILSPFWIGEMGKKQSCASVSLQASSKVPPSVLRCVCACCSALGGWNGRQWEWWWLNDQWEAPELNVGREISGAGSFEESKGLCFLLLSLWHWGNAGQLLPDPSLIKRFLWVRTGMHEEATNWMLWGPCSASCGEAGEEIAP